MMVIIKVSMPGVVVTSYSFALLTLALEDIQVELIIEAPTFSLLRREQHHLLQVVFYKEGWNRSF